MYKHTKDQAPLLIEKNDDCWVLSLNRPKKRNALSLALVEAMLGAFDKAETEGIPLVVLKGIGKNFCAGFDFSNLDALSNADLLLRFVRIESLLQRIRHSSCVTLALAHGTNMGAGADLIASSTFRVATPSAQFKMPGLQFGLVLGTRRLEQLIGAQNALNILQSSRLFSAQEAYEINFLNQIAEQDTWNTLISTYLTRTTTLPEDSNLKLRDLLTPDTRAQDMAELVASAAQPDIKKRIYNYISSF